MKQRGLPYGKRSGFAVPEGYFEEFESRMQHFYDAPTAFLKGKQQHPFKVPEEYFEQLEDRILQNIGSQENKKVRKLRSLRTKDLSYIAGIAAALLVLFSSIVLSRGQKTDFEDLEISAVENYLFESLQIRDEENLTVIEEGDFEYSTTTDTNIDKEALLEYLKEHVEEPAILFYSE